MPLTKAKVEGAKPKAKPYDIRDGGRLGITGLILRVYPSGRRTFFFQRKRREQWHRIGPAGPYTLEMARDKAVEMFRQIEAGDVPGSEIDPNIALADFIKDHYKPHYDAHERSARTLLALNQFKHRSDEEDEDKIIITGFYDSPVRAITADLVEDWREERLLDGAKRATINRNVDVLKACLAYAVKKKVISKHPIAGLKRLKAEKENRVRYLSSDEETRLKTALVAREARIREERRSANAWRAERGYDLLPDLGNYKFADHLRPMVLLAMNTGVRQGELFSLSWADVVEGRTIIVQSRNAKSRTTRHIPLNREVRETLDAWRDQTDSKRLVFASTDGNRFDTVKKSWQGVLADAGISDFRWHDLRHHFASKLVMAGVPLNTVRELLGHADLKMTLRYAHLAPGHMREAVELISA
jgi:integrase